MEPKIERYGELVVFTDIIDLSSLENPDLRQIAFEQKAKSVLSAFLGYLIVERDFQLLPTLAGDVAYAHRDAPCNSENCYNILVIDTSLSTSHPDYSQALSKILSQARQRMRVHNPDTGLVRTLVNIHEHEPAGRNFLLFEHSDTFWKNVEYFVGSFELDIVARYGYRESQELLKELRSKMLAKE